MDLTFSPDELEFRDEVRAFLEEKLEPELAELRGAFEDEAVRGWLDQVKEKRKSVQAQRQVLDFLYRNPLPLQQRRAIGSGQALTDDEHRRRCRSVLF